MHTHHDDDHDRGLAFDLQTMSRQMIARRQALAWFGGVSGAMLLAGCGGGGGSGSGTTSTETSSATGSSGTSTTTGSSGSSTATTTTTTTTGTASGSCIADPTETSGPYPADGTNTSSGSTSNVLTQSGIVRSDIRSSFLASMNMSSGVLVTITITLVSVANACTPLSGYAIYFWHCDNNGHYSLYTEPTESYLRGVQVTDANGQVTFTTFFPAAYDGRWPHYHFEVFSSLSAATSGKAAVLTSQFCMPSDLCNTIYADTSLYPSSASIFKGVSLSTDNVFGDNSAAQIAQQTPSFSSNGSGGYTATATVGI